VCSCSKFLRPALYGEERGHAGVGTKAGPVLGCDWQATPAAWETRADVGGQRSDFPISQFQLSAFVLTSQLWSEDFTAKLFCNVEFWLERLPKLIGFRENAAIAVPNIEDVALGGSEWRA